MGIGSDRGRQQRGDAQRVIDAGPAFQSNGSTAKIEPIDIFAGIVDARLTIVAGLEHDVAGFSRNLVAFHAGDSNSAVGRAQSSPATDTGDLMPPLLVLRTRYVSLGTVTSILADARLIRSKKLPNLLAVTTILSPSWCVVYSIRSGCRRLALTTASPAIPEMMVMLPLNPLKKLSQLIVTISISRIKKKNLFSLKKKPASQYNNCPY